MAGQMQIVSKVSEMVLEYQTGVPRPRKPVAAPSGARTGIIDAVTISDTGETLRKITSRMDTSHDKNHQDTVQALKRNIENQSYTFNETIVEEIARTIIKAVL